MSRTVCMVTALLLASAASSAAPPIAAAAPAPFPLAVTVSEGYTGNANRVAVEATAATGSSCKLRVLAGQRSRSFDSARLGRSGRHLWSWSPSANAPRGRWTFIVRCTLGSLFAWRSRVVEPGIPAPAGALARQPGSSRGSCDAQGLCLSAGPFEVGQCTWYAAGRRPDLIGVVHGNAGGWLAAAAGRVPEGRAPAVGALAVWRPDRPPAGPLGHVAYVAAVSGARVLVDDSNWLPTPTSAALQVHEHWVSAAAPSGYIYGGPAGDGAPP